jgi:hypothetical protein
LYNGRVVVVSLAENGGPKDFLVVYEEDNDRTEVLRSKQLYENDGLNSEGMSNSFSIFVPSVLCLPDDLFSLINRLASDSKLEGTVIPSFKFIRTDASQRRCMIDIVL